MLYNFNLAQAELLLLWAIILYNTVRPHIQLVCHFFDLYMGECGNSSFLVTRHLNPRGVSSVDAACHYQTVDYFALLVHLPHSVHTREIW